jgi:YgiT-type zinc finger domain-containing protein
MNCHVCGGKLEQRVTDMPFKVSDQTIVILKEASRAAQRELW